MRNPLKVRFTEYGYGFFPGGDPRLFHPDSDGTRPEELENHRKVCEAWDNGQRASRPDCTHGEGFVLTTCQFGLGSYEYPEELWAWDWARWVWWPRISSRMWWRWHFDVRNWVKARGMFRSRLVRRMFGEA